MMKRSRAMLSLASIAAASALPAAAQTREKLRVAYPVLDQTSEVIYAYEMGFFERAFLDIELMPLVNGAAIAAGVASGQIDIGLGNTLTVMTAFRKGIPFTLIAPAAMSVNASPSNLLTVARNSPIRDARELNGKTIGVSPLHATGEVLISAWMDKNGGDSSTAKFIEVPFSLAQSMLDAGRVDAAFSSEPFITEARGTTRVLANPFGVIGENWLLTAFFALHPWATAHASTVARFASVIRSTAKWANRNQDTTAPMLAKHAKLDVNIVRQTARARFAATLNPDQVQPVIDASAKYKVFDSTFRAAELIFQA